MKKNNTSSSRQPALDRLYRALSLCSIRCLFRISAWLAIVLAHTKNQLSTQARQNIQLCFPQLNPLQQKQLHKDTLHHTCCAFFELASLWYRPIEQVLQLVDTQHIDEHYYRSSKAKIIIAPHHGSWELLNLWLAAQGPLYSLYKPAKSASLDQHIIDKRTRNDAHLVPVSTGGLRSLLKALKSQASCMILPDQRPAENTACIDAPFYGHMAPTSLLIKKMASKIDCEIFIAAITRNLKSASYGITIKALDRNEFIENDLHSATYLNRSIETFIQSDISQYQWPYRRFLRETYRISA